ncbi:MAG: hypothetical protein IKU37_03620 [Candidatus Gastranaerophilales bacterium]|nr:hypothetical protein [Candidatus Gastranaerophilales bacterium]
MLKTIKMWWLQHLKDVEEYKRKDIAEKRAIVRAFVMRWYEAKHQAEKNPIPYWIEANKELEANVKTDADVLYHFNNIKKYIKKI